MKFLVVIFCLFLSFSLSAKSLQEAEKKLFDLFETLKITYDREESFAVSRQIEKALYEVLQNPESFNFPFESLNFLGRIHSEDNLLRIYTWNKPLFDDKTYTYGGIIQQREGNRLTVLRVANPAFIPPTVGHISTENWYGALYFRAIPVTHRRKTFYTLLGWSGNDDLTTVKLIDVLSFDEDGNAKLGLPVFKMSDNRVKYRVILEHRNDVSMTLDYDRRNRQIIFDHLSPPDIRFRGIYSFYGPDFSFDAFQLRRGEWIHREDVDVRQGR